MLQQTKLKRGNESEDGTWVVLNVGSGGELSTGSETVGHHTLEHDGLEVGTGKVDGSGVAGRAGSNDDHLRVGRGLGNWWHC